MVLERQERKDHLLPSDSITDARGHIEFEATIYIVDIDTLALINVVVAIQHVTSDIATF
jgi:hypothetical protein